jgi:hypothetical protein
MVEGHNGWFSFPSRAGIDLTGDFCTSQTETGRQKGTWEHAEEDVRAGADRAEAAAD